MLNPEGEHVAPSGERVVLPVDLRVARLASTDVDERDGLAVRTGGAVLNPTDESFEVLVVPVRFCLFRLCAEPFVNVALEDMHRVEPQAGFDRFAQHPPQRDVAQGGVAVAVVREHAAADIGMRAGEPDLLQRVIFREWAVGGDPRLVGEVGAALVESERLTEVMDVARSARKRKSPWPNSADRRDGILSCRPLSIITLRWATLRNPLTQTPTKWTST